MSAFARALEMVLEAEGGFINDPADPGGATNKGITQRTYDHWREEQGQDPEAVSAIAQHEVEGIYFAHYWRDGSCDKLPDAVAIVQFDSCVNVGVVAAAKILQRTVNVDDDGIIGPVTLGVVGKLNQDLFREALLWQRLRYYRDITLDESNALVELGRAVREERWSAVEELVDKAEGLKFLRFWIKRLLDLRGGL